MLSVACEFFLKLFFLFFSLSWSLSRLLLLPFNTVCATFFSVFALNDSLLSTYPVAATHERNYFLIFHHFISFMPSAEKRRFFFFLYRHMFFCWNYCQRISRIRSTQESKDNQNIDVYLGRKMSWMTYYTVTYLKNDEKCPEKTYSHTI